MSRDKQIEGKVFTDVDILANDINQHCADLAETYCGDTNCLTCLAHALTNKGYRKASDVALETVDSFQRILRHIFLNMCDGNDYERLNLLQIDGAIEALYDSFIAELKKKYLGEDINAPTKESEGEG